MQKQYDYTKMVGALCSGKRGAVCSEEVGALSSGQRGAVTPEFPDKRIVHSYSLDMDRKNIWAFIEGGSEQDVMDILSTFPIIKYVKIHIHELAFFDRAPLSLPEPIMN